MIWFALFQLLGFIALIVLIVLYCRIRKVGFWSLIWQHLKWFFAAAVVIFIIISIICWRPLYSTTQCYFRGVSMHADTKYSWYLGECQFKTSSGSYVPLTRGRGIPEGHDNQLLDDPQDIY
ncbi:hypothetical protein RHO15_04230 [Utexia brackfieldae]|uniref:hypothetical protein n=1 Tax=Utexia brackfieldae TaxID=3074108 RepID=UPI00370D1629